MKSMMNCYRYAGLVKDDICDGEGIGLSFYTQFCPHRCDSCHNKATWDKDGGLSFNESILDNIISYFKENPIADRITLSGGEAFENVDLCHIILDEIQRNNLNLNIWIFSGYTYEEITGDGNKLKLLERCDVLVDGKFEINKRDIKLKYCGSSNQQIINVKESLRQNKIIQLIKQ